MSLFKKTKKQTAIVPSTPSAPSVPSGNKICSFTHGNQVSILSGIHKGKLAFVKSINPSQYIIETIEKKYIAKSQFVPNDNTRIITETPQLFRLKLGEKTVVDVSKDQITEVIVFQEHSGKLNLGNVVSVNEHTFTVNTINYTNDDDFISQFQDLGLENQKNSQKNMQNAQKILKKLSEKVQNNANEGIWDTRRQFEIKKEMLVARVFMIYQKHDLIGAFGELQAIFEPQYFVEIKNTKLVSKDTPGSEITPKTLVLTINNKDISTITYIVASDQDSVILAPRFKQRKILFDDVFFYDVKYNGHNAQVLKCINDIVDIKVNVNNSFETIRVEKNILEPLSGFKWSNSPTKSSPTSFDDDFVDFEDFEEFVPQEVQEYQETFGDASRLNKPEIVLTKLQKQIMTEITTISAKLKINNVDQEVVVEQTEKLIKFLNNKYNRNVELTPDFDYLVATLVFFGANLGEKYTPEEYSSKLRTLGYFTSDKITKLFVFKNKSPFDFVREALGLVYTNLTNDRQIVLENLIPLKTKNEGPSETLKLDYFKQNKSYLKKNNSSSVMSSASKTLPRETQIMLNFKQKSILDDIKRKLVSKNKPELQFIIDNLYRGPFAISEMEPGQLRDYFIKVWESFLEKTPTSPTQMSPVSPKRIFSSPLEAASARRRRLENRMDID